MIQKRQHITNKDIPGNLKNATTVPTATLWQITKWQTTKASYHEEEDTNAASQEGTYVELRCKMIYRRIETVA